jgi:hypothetical protein
MFKAKLLKKMNSVLKITYTNAGGSAATPIVTGRAVWMVFPLVLLFLALVGAAARVVASRRATASSNRDPGSETPG